MLVYNDSKWGVMMMNYRVYERRRSLHYNESCRKDVVKPQRGKWGISS